MFRGTTIDELMRIVERAEVSARDERPAPDPQAHLVVYPGFLADVQKKIDLTLMGVA